MKHRSLYKGILLILSGAFWFAVMSALGRHLSGFYHPMHVVCLRNVCALATVAFFLPKVIHHLQKSNRKKTYLLRGFLSQSATSFWFLAIAQIPLVNATAISFSTPIFSTFVAYFLLKERLNNKRWMGLFIGFIGVIFILHPQINTWQVGYVFALAASMCWAFVNTAIKSLSNTEPPLAIVFMMLLIMSLLSIPMAIPVWKPIDPETYLWLVLLGVTTVLWQVSISYAYRFGSVGELQPFEYMRLLFAVAIGVAFFEEQMDITAFIGVAIIFFASFLGLKPKR
jgi:drug/metabolite transporter (DMT)-like permease